MTRIFGWIKRVLGIEPGLVETETVLPAFWAEARRAVAAETATLTFISLVSPPVLNHRRNPRPLAAQLAIQARLNVPKNRKATAAKATSAKPKPIKTTVLKRLPQARGPVLPSRIVGTKASLNRRANVVSLTPIVVQDRVIRPVRIAA
jgi:hypothetical protein